MVLLCLKLTTTTKIPASSPCTTRPNTSPGRHGAPSGYVQKSRVAAGILAILLGTYGIHSFYLGNTSRGLLQLLLSLFTCGIGAIVMFIWGIVDGVRILDGRINTDANGVFLKD